MCCLSCQRTYSSERRRTPTMTSRVPKIPLVTFLAEQGISCEVTESFSPRRKNRVQKRTEALYREEFLAAQRAAVREGMLLRQNAAIDRHREQATLEKVPMTDRLFALKALAVESHRYQQSISNRTHSMCNESYCRNVLDDIDYLMRKPMRDPLGRNSPNSSSAQSPRSRDRYSYVKLELAAINMWRPNLK